MGTKESITTPGHVAAGPPPAPTIPPTPLSWRLVIAAVVFCLAVAAFTAHSFFGQGEAVLRAQAGMGVLAFIGVVALFSANLRAINWRTIGWGFALQVLLALFVLKFEVFGYRPGYELFNGLASVAKKFLEFTDAGSRFVFGSLADPAVMEPTFNNPKLVGHALGSPYAVVAAHDKETHPLGFVFAIRALPTIVFISAFFSVLYYFGILQRVVRVMAWGMRYLMRTSGAETLSVTANVVMGQTEAPLIVKPYVAGMTESELLALMVGGMAHISGGLMAVYIGLGADPVAILATSVMASPCSLYLTKLMLPETGKPVTSGAVQYTIDQTHTSAVDAAAGGASDGMRLAINIAAMLIAFIAFITLFDYLLGQASTGINHVCGTHLELSLAKLFGWVFAPVAYLMGVAPDDVPKIADLLGTKLVANEFVAYVDYKRYYDELSPRSRVLATYALTGFANFASIGIQLGGIGAMAPGRRADLARLGGRALLTGFLVTLVNASIAGLLL
jgi:concentrative nucleoside transporter, CNT family